MFSASLAVSYKSHLRIAVTGWFVGQIPFLPNQQCLRTECRTILSEHTKIIDKCCIFSSFDMFIITYSVCPCCTKCLLCATFVG